MVIGNLWLPVVRGRYITNEQIISQNPSHANIQIVHYEKRNPLQQTEKKHFSCKVTDVPLCNLQSLIQRTACLIILNTNTSKETRQLLSLSAKHSLWLLPLFVPDGCNNNHRISSKYCWVSSSLCLWWCLLWEATINGFQSSPGIITSESPRPASAQSCSSNYQYIHL